MRRATALTVLTVSALFAWVTPAVAAPTKGARLPELAFQGEDQGLIVRKGDDAVYAPFSLRAVTKGKVAIVIYMAGRQGADDMGTPLLEALIASKLPPASFVPLVIVDLDDCLFGTCALVQSSMEDMGPPVAYVIDEKGAGRKVMRLPEEGFAAFLVDRKGIIRRVKQGAFKQADVAGFMAEAQALIAWPAKAPAAAPGQ